MASTATVVPLSAVDTVNDYSSYNYSNNAQTVSRTITSNPDTNYIYEHTNVWCAFYSYETKRMHVMKHQFYMTKPEGGNKGNQVGLRNKLIGQFITSLWFSHEATIQSSYTFYVIAADKKYTADDISMILNQKNDYARKFYYYDQFELLSSRLCSTFDSMMNTNHQTTRIILYSKLHPTTTLSIHLSLKHLFSEMHNDPELEQTGLIKETVVMSTPCVVFT